MGILTMSLFAVPGALQCEALMPPWSPVALAPVAGILGPCRWAESWYLHSKGNLIQLWANVASIHSVDSLKPKILPTPPSAPTLKNTGETQRVIF